MDSSQNDTLTDFQLLQLALYQMWKAEGQNSVDALVREACCDAATDGDHERALRIAEIHGVGGAFSFEILAALGRFLEEQEVP